MNTMHAGGPRALAGRRSIQPVASTSTGSTSSKPPAPSASRPLSRRSAQILEFADGWGVDTPSGGGKASSGAAGGLDAGWGVSVSTAPALPKQATLRKKAGKKGAAVDPSEPEKEVRRSGAYVPLRSQRGVMGLSLLAHQLKEGATGKLSKEARAKLDEAGGEGGGPRRKLSQVPLVPGSAAATAARGHRGKGRDDFLDEDMVDNEEEAEEFVDTPEFALNFGEGETEFVDYDEFGNITRVGTDGLGGDPDDEDDDDYDEGEADSSALDFGGSSDAADDDGWGQFDTDGSAGGSGAAASGSGREGRKAGMTDSDVEAFMRGEDAGGGSASPAGSSGAASTSAAAVRRRALRFKQEAAADGVRQDDYEGDRDAYGDDYVGDDGVDDGPLEEFEEADDWGLEELGGGTKRMSLMRRLGVVGGGPVKHVPEAGERRTADLDIQWGGTGVSASGIDFDEQEALLARLYKPHLVKKFMKEQHEVAESWMELRQGRVDKDSRLHSQLRIVAGTAAGRKLMSASGDTTRPMMEKVRSAIMSMVQSRLGAVNGLPSDTRWLDLFAGTGSVGLEALSRGAGLCHFIEMDKWVARKVLSRNIKACGLDGRATIHTMKAEDFLRKSISTPRFAGGAFDILTVCPPYLKVSYPEIFDLLERSPLLHADSIMFVEYPKQLSREVPDAVGPLVRVQDRKYGRTLVAVYGPPEGGAIGGGDEDDEEEEGEQAGARGKRAAARQFEEEDEMI